MDACSSQPGLMSLRPAAAAGAGSECERNARPDACAAARSFLAHCQVLTQVRGTHEIQAVPRGDAHPTARADLDLHPKVYDFKASPEEAWPDAEVRVAPDKDGRYWTPLPGIRRAF